MPEDIRIAIIWIVCALAIERITEIITEGDIFDDWRRFLGRRANPMLPPPPEDLDNNLQEVLGEAQPDDYGEPELEQTWTLWFWKKVNKLFACGFCMSTWVAFAFSWFLPGSWDEMPGIIVKTFALMFMANMAHSIFQLVYRGRIHTYDHAIKIDKAEDVNV
jgi:hypothetical protein